MLETCWGWSTLVLALTCGSASGGIVWDDKEHVLGMARGVGEVELSFGFRVEREGSVIWKLESDCPCAKVSVAKERVRVGERGEVLVKTKFPSTAGRHRQEVIVWTGDVPDVREVLKIVGLVEGPGLLRPAILTWRIGEPPTGKSLEVKLPAGGQIGDGARSRPELFDVKGSKDGVTGASRLEIVPRDTSRPGRSIISLDLKPSANGPRWTLMAVAQVQ